MGYTSYSSEDRSLRAKTSGFHTKTVNEIFTQNVERKIHESMNPMNARLREARDSDIHPATVPIILGLDLTGSMGKIPHYLVKDGLPNLMGRIIQRGIPSPALLFLGIGDTQCDHYPLQVGQFESGDQELDTWLTRTYIESGGGGNEGESYLLAWYFAAKHTATDAWDKRKQKGFLFTTGDEPSLKTLPKNSITGLMGDPAETNFSDQQLLALAQEKWNVYHLHIMQGSAGRQSLGYWKELLGDNCIVVDNYENIASIIADTVCANAGKEPIKENNNQQQATTTEDAGNKSEEIIL